MASVASDSFLSEKSRSGRVDSDGQREDSDRYGCQEQHRQADREVERSFGAERGWGEMGVRNVDQRIGSEADKALVEKIRREPPRVDEDRKLKSVEPVDRLESRFPSVGVWQDDETGDLAGRYGMFHVADRDTVGFAAFGTYVVGIDSQCGAESEVRHARGCKLTECLRHSSRSDDCCREGDPSVGDAFLSERGDYYAGYVDEEEEESEKETEEKKDEKNTVASSTTKYKVYIDAPSGVEAYLDGSYIGITPVSFNKAEGSYVVTLRKSGYQTRSYTLQIDAEEKDVNYSFTDLIKLEE